MGERVRDLIRAVDINPVFDEVVDRLNILLGDNLVKESPALLVRRDNIAAILNQLIKEKKFGKIIIIMRVTER